MRDFVLQPTQEGELRRRALFWIPAPLPLLGLLYLLVGGSLSASGWTILLASSVGVGTLLLALVVQPTPLPEGLAPPVSARRSLHRFRQFTQLRISLALVTVVIGAAASVAGGGMYPLFAALALAWPQLLLAMPTFFTITRARRAMEAWGTTAYLWHALSRPADVTWPIATPLAAAWRSWRAENARQDQRAQEEEQAWKRAVREESTRTGEDASSAEDDERTRPLRPVAEEAVDQEATDVLPHLGSKEPSERDGGERPTEVLPKLGTVPPQTRTTRVLPHLGGAEEDGDADASETGPSASADAGRGTVNRARSLLSQGSGALGLAARRTRRGVQSVRRPHPRR
ncbi:MULTISPECIES: hypothetical protein [unclassified Nocardiopsis]|uniref:hypothetical protein n=1 Tax=unclassified Nocardiopsis TaxID=2649073 RepID=UPI00135CE81E|nr:MULTISPECIES: hypothetical protein [unclassified Nocardiopsis]